MAFESDFALLDQYAEGEERAFEQLVVRHQRIVYNMALRIVGNHDDAADITQQVFPKVLADLKRFERRSSFRTWIYTIADNLCRNHLKRTKKMEWVELPVEERDRGETSPKLLIKRERDRRVREAILELPERQRLTLILRSYHHMSHQEIAQVLNINENNARVNYFHALKNLKSTLIRRGGIDEL